MTAPGPRGDPGPLGDEARLLVEAARDWAARTFPDVGAHLATGSAECQWCPLCRAVAALRTPEMADRIAGAVTTAAGAVASLLDALANPAPVPDPAAPAPAPVAPAAPAAPARAAAPGRAPAAPAPAAAAGPVPRDVPGDED
jgi:hypothetical protein